jgi:DNA repair protein RadC
MKKKKNQHSLDQKHLFEILANQPRNSKFISVYRVSLVRDQSVAFEQRPLSNSVQAHHIIRKLIETQGQPDREQFCIVLLSAKNVIIGLNIVAMGDLVSATVSVREMLKPVIIGNAAAIICAHNHPSNELTPSPADMTITKKIIHASEFMGIHVLEHLIISMESDAYYSFADTGIIQSIYDEVKQLKAF